MKHRTFGEIITLAALCIGLLLTLPLRAEVLARLSSATTSLEQPIQLTLEIQGAQNASPDLSVLDEDFEILGRASQQSLSMINGTVSSKRSLILTLLAKRQGKLTIPPIPFGDQQTRPLTLEVTAQPQGQSGTNQQQAWVELSLNKSEAYPEEEVILTLKLYRAAGVRGEYLDQPQPSLGDTRLQLLDESEDTMERNGGIYRVLERNYGLYAYQTGTLEIAPVRFRGHSAGASVFSLLDDPFANPLRTGRPILTRSDPVSLNIKPIPKDFTGDHWLPARNVQLVATGIDSGAPLLAGKPVTRRIMLIADGLMSSQLPAIVQQTPDEIKPYEERPQLKDTPRKSGVSGSRESVVTLIPTRAGRFTLPAIEIPWWNTETGKQEIARLPEATLEVLPGATADSTPVVTAQQTPSTEHPIAEKKQETNTPAPAIAEDDGIHWVVWALAAAWLATLGGWWLSHRHRSRAEPAPESAAVPPVADDHRLTAAVAALSEAYRQPDAMAAREAWLQWGRQRWPENPPHNLTRLAGRCSPPIAEAVISLEKALYSPAVATGWAELFDPATLRVEPQQAADPQPIDEQLLPLNP